MDKVKAKNQYIHREPWGCAVIDGYRPHFSKFGYTIPDDVKYTTSFPSQGKKNKGSMGEVVQPDASSDRHFEITSSFDEDDAATIVRNVGHNLLHVVTTAEHGQKFKDAALRLGYDLTDGLRKALPGPTMEDLVQSILNAVGPLPHRKIDFDKVGRIIDREKSQAGRDPMKLIECLHQVGDKPHGYKLRASRSTLEEGIPLCPVHGVKLTPQLKEGEPPIVEKTPIKEAAE